jgi:hypothetical protein
MMGGGLICGGVDWGADKKFCEKKKVNAYKGYPKMQVCLE